MKNLLLSLVRKLPIGPVRQEMLLFFLKLGYFPNFASPKTFNEKINHRKLFLKDSLMVSCMDKIAVRDYVAEKIGAQTLTLPLFPAMTEADVEQVCTTVSAIVSGQID